MPSTSRWLYPLALIIILVCVSYAYYLEILKTKDIINPLLSVFGTFFGATFAFRLNEEKERKKLLDMRRESLNRALFVLVRQINAIHQLSQLYIKYQTPFERAFNFPAMKPPLYEDLIFSFTELDFLLDSDNPGLLIKIAVEQERFHQAIESFRLRNEFYVQEIQPAIEKIKLNGKIISSNEAEKLLGERLFGSAINLANSVWEHITYSNNSIPEVHNELLIQAKLMFPGKKFITYEIPVSN